MNPTPTPDFSWNKLIPDCVKTIDGNEVASLDCIPAVFHNFTYWAFIFAGIIALILIIYSGIKFILSGGDPKQAEGARKTLTYAIIGFVVILFSFLAINIVSIVTGVECINSFGINNCKDPATLTPTPETSIASPSPTQAENKWTRGWNLDEKVSVKEWWDDMTTKGYISIDATVQQSPAGEQINDFINGHDLVPTPDKYYAEGYGLLGTCKSGLDDLVAKGQGYITIKPEAYDQIPGDDKCQIFTNSK